MEVGPFPIFLKGNGRTGTFHHNTPHSNAQRFYPILLESLHQGPDIFRIPRDNADIV